ncbi:hypothetical protein VKT23_010863 [Stygiomarasmius scandens]|uniref:Uncharacterized protein n=1 Tax=Marasmiellus scandens TaxID=2682957 RepID=A0ABR1JBC0_9AGAR
MSLQPNNDHRTSSIIDQTTVPASSTRLTGVETLKLQFPMQHSTAVVIALDSRQCNITMLFTPIIACSRPYRLPTRLCPFSSPVISVPTLTLPLPLPTLILPNSPLSPGTKHLPSAHRMTGP